MKTVLNPSNYIFDAGTQTIDFSPFPAFDQTRLFAIINTSYDRGVLIYTTGGGSTLGSTFSGSVMTFMYDTTPMSNSDLLCVIYDDPTAEQVISNDTITYDSGNIGFTPNNAINNSTDGIYCAPYRTAYAQVTQSSGIVRMQPEGSMDGNVWYSLPSRVIGTTSNPVTAASDWTTSGTDIIAIPLDCNYVRIRVMSSAGTFRMMTYFTQQAYASPWAFNMLLSNSGRISDWGTGTSSAQTLRVVTSDDSQIIGKELYIASSAQSTLNINLMTGTSSSYDVSGYKSISIQIVGSAGISAGALTWEGSNDNANWFTQILIPPDNSTPTPITSAMTIAASSTRQLCASLPFRYYRLRISTGFTGGTVSAQFRLSPNHYTGMAIPVIGTVTSSISGSVGLTSFTSLDISASNIATATTTYNTASLSNTQCMSFNLNVSAFTGTYQDTVIQSSLDGGTNWFDLYHFPRATGTGQFNSGPIKIVGNNIRYARTTVGATVSITSTLTRTSRQVDGPIYNVFFDRAVAPNTLNSTTSSFFVEGCDEFTMVVNMGAITTTAPAFQLEGSEDNVNFYSIGSTLTAVANSTVALATGTAAAAKWIRARVSSAGSGATLGYVCLKGKNI